MAEHAFEAFNLVHPASLAGLSKFHFHRSTADEQNQKYRATWPKGQVPQLQIAPSADRFYRVTYI
jgi:hypothetical protein